MSHKRDFVLDICGFLYICNSVHIDIFCTCSYMHSILVLLRRNRV